MEKHRFWVFITRMLTDKTKRLIVYCYLKYKKCSKMCTCIVLDGTCNPHFKLNELTFYFFYMTQNNCPSGGGKGPNVRKAKYSSPCVCITSFPCRDQKPPTLVKGMFVPTVPKQLPVCSALQFLISLLSLPLPPPRKFILQRTFVTSNNCSASPRTCNSHTVCLLLLTVTVVFLFLIM